MAQYATAYRTVMVVEDDEDTRLMLRRTLEVCGYQVREAVNSREAIKVASRRCPDLILLDLGQPVVDGLAAARSLREVKELCHVPIVAITAYDGFGFEEAAFAAGCDEYLIKPFDFEQLATILQRFLIMEPNLASDGGIERRRKPRIYQPFPATLRALDQHGHRFEATTTLDNLSAGGFYLRLTRPVEKGAKVSIVTRLSTGPAQGPLVVMRGTVVRTEPQADGRYGIAVMIKQRRFL